MNETLVVYGISGIILHSCTEFIWDHDKLLQGSLINNQDSMESKRVFFAAHFLFLIDFGGVFFRPLMQEREMCFCTTSTMMRALVCTVKRFLFATFQPLQGGEA